MTKKRKPLFSSGREQASEIPQELLHQQNKTNETNKSANKSEGPINKMKEKIKMMLDTDSTYPFF